MTNKSGIKAARSSSPQGKGLSKNKLEELELKLFRTQLALESSYKTIETLKIENQQIINSDSHGIRIINKDHTIRIINQAFADMSGMSPEIAIGKHCWEIFPSPFCNTTKCRLNRILQGEERIEAEIERTKKDGTVIPCIATAFPLWEISGEITGIVETFKDVTGRKKLQERIAESEERYRALIELGTEAGEAIVMLQDIDGKEGMQTFFNDQWPKITGYTKEELFGISFFEIVHPSDRQMSLERHRQKMLGKTVSGLYEMKLIRKDGVEFFVELTGAFTTYQGKRANVVFIRDITLRKEIQEKLEESENLYRTIFNTTGTAMQILDGEGTVIKVNEEWVKLFGYTRQEAEGKICYLQLVPKNRMIYQEKVFRRTLVVPASLPKTYEAKIVDIKGERKDVFVTASSIPQTNLHVVSLLDITLLKQIQRRIKNSESRLRLLSRRMIKTAEEERVGIARELHDELAQGLIVIRFDAVSLKERVRESSLYEQLDGMIERVDTLLNSVRDISTRLRPKMLDELGLLGAIQWYVKNFEQHMGIPCKVNMNVKAIEVSISKEISIEAYRILQEAMLNVFRHSKADGIVIDLFIKRGKLVVSIVDNGIGINVKAIDSSSSLGLLGMQERASLAGGNLTIRTRSKRGTRITASFPLCIKELSRPKERQKNDKSTAG